MQSVQPMLVSPSFEPHKIHSIRAGRTSGNVEKGRQEHKELLSRTSSLPCFSKYRGDVYYGMTKSGSQACMQGMWRFKNYQKKQSNLPAARSNKRATMLHRLPRRKEIPHKAKVTPQLAGERYQRNPFISLDRNYLSTEPFDPLAIVAPNVKCEMEEEIYCDKTPELLMKRMRARRIRNQQFQGLHRRSTMLEDYRSSARRSHMDEEQFKRAYRYLSNLRSDKDSLASGEDSRPQSRLSLRSLDFSRDILKLTPSPEKPTSRGWRNKPLMGGRRSSTAPLPPQLARMLSRPSGESLTKSLYWEQFSKSGIDTGRSTSTGRLSTGRLSTAKGWERPDSRPDSRASGVVELYPSVHYPSQGESGESGEAREAREVGEAGEAGEAGDKKEEDRAEDADTKVEDEVVVSIEPEFGEVATVLEEATVAKAEEANAAEVAVAVSAKEPTKEEVTVEAAPAKVAVEEGKTEQPLVELPEKTVATDKMRTRDDFPHPNETADNDTAIEAGGKTDNPEYLENKDEDGNVAAKEQKPVEPQIEGWEEAGEENLEPAAFPRVPTKPLEDVQSGALEVKHVYKMPDP